jgi:hypothetical protein
LTLPTLARGCLLVLLLGGCKPPPSNEGFVAVQVPRGFTVPPLALATDNWFGSPAAETFAARLDGSSIVLRRRPGAYQLMVKRSDQLQSLCKFEVKQDRVTTITLKPVGRDLRCEIVA